ncbi:MAG: DUF2934 domain-containing protein [Methylotenera sp.]|jgi:hypothetical protein
MAVSPTKKPVTKTTAKKTTTTKKPAAKKTATKKDIPKARKISAEERYKMVEVAAYYIAEHHQFKGNAIDFWIAAEEEINKKLA